MTCKTCGENTDDSSPSGIGSIAQCKCKSGYFNNGLGCGPEAGSCGGISSDVGGHTFASCHCNAGFFNDGTECQFCGEGSVRTPAPAGSPATHITRIDQCKCLANYYNDGTGCIKCPDNSTSVAGTTSVSQCKCNSGYWMNGNGCESCGNDGYVLSTSPSGITSSRECACRPGYYNDGNGCNPCNSENSRQPAATSPGGVGNISSCRCPEGFIFDAVNRKCICPAGKYKQGSTCKECGPAGSVDSTSGAGNDDVTNCTCAAGYFNNGTTGCATCGPPESINRAPGGAVSGAQRGEQCKCAAGYYSTSGGCRTCGPGVNQNSPVNATLGSQCKCKSGYLNSGDGCVTCMRPSSGHTHSAETNTDSNGNSIATILWECRCLEDSLMTYDRFPHESIPRGCAGRAEIASRGWGTQF